MLSTYIDLLLLLFIMMMAFEEENGEAIDFGSQTIEMVTQENRL